MTNARAIAATIKALKPHLREEHAALVRAATILAGAMDDPENRSSAAMWKQYRESIVDLLAIVPEAKSEDAQATLRDLVRPALVDAAKSSAKDARPGPRPNRRRVGQTADAVAAAGRERRPRATA